MEALCRGTDIVICWQIDLCTDLSSKLISTWISHSKDTVREEGYPTLRTQTYVEAWGFLTIHYGCYVNFSSVSVNSKDSKRGLINSYSRNVVGNFLSCFEIWSNLQPKIPKMFKWSLLRPLSSPLLFHLNSFKSSVHFIHSFWNRAVYFLPW